MYPDKIHNVLNEPNWLVKIWYGGQIYEKTQNSKPEPPQEIYLSFPIVSTKFKHVRDLIINKKITEIITTHNIKSEQTIRSIKNKLMYLLVCNDVHVKELTNLETDIFLT